jgi:AraC family transcriptional regulator
VLRNQGAYADLDVAYGRLFAWMARQGALESISGIWGIPHHDRRDDAPEISRFDCCLATGMALAAADGVTPAELGGGEYARARHVGSFAQLDDAHDAVLRQILQLPGVTLRDAAILHEYLNDPESTPEAELATHIYVPVTRLPEARS